MRNMHRSRPIVAFVNGEICRFFPARSGYSDKYDLDAFWGERAGNRAAVQVNPSDCAIPVRSADIGPQVELSPSSPLARLAENW
jgi:hypothetical protein